MRENSLPVTEFRVAQGETANADEARIAVPLSSTSTSQQFINLDVNCTFDFSIEARGEGYHSPLVLRIFFVGQITRKSTTKFLIAQRLLNMGRYCVLLLGHVSKILLGKLTDCPNIWKQGKGGGGFLIIMHVPLILCMCTQQFQLPPPPPTTSPLLTSRNSCNRYHCRYQLQ